MSRRLSERKSGAQTYFSSSVERPRMKSQSASQEQDHKEDIIELAARNDKKTNMDSHSRAKEFEEALGPQTMGQMASLYKQISQDLEKSREARKEAFLASQFEEEITSRSLRPQTANLNKGKISSNASENSSQGSFYGSTTPSGPSVRKKLLQIIRPDDILKKKRGDFQQASTTANSKVSFRLNSSLDQKVPWARKGRYDKENDFNRERRAVSVSRDAGLDPKILEEVDYNLCIKHDDKIENHKRDIYSWLHLNFPYKNLKVKLRAKIIEILKDKETGPRLLACYKKFEKDKAEGKLNGKGIADYQISLEMAEINKFRSEELKELKSYLPRSSFNYMRQLKKNGLKTGDQSLGSSKSVDAPAFAYDKSEIESRLW